MVGFKLYPYSYRILHCHMLLFHSLQEKLLGGVQWDQEASNPLRSICGGPNDFQISCIFGDKLSMQYNQVLS